jgi:hypothetical protein
VAVLALLQAATTVPVDVALRLERQTAVELQGGGLDTSRLLDRL